jgi:hypothetical protein
MGNEIEALIFVLEKMMMMKNGGYGELGFFCLQLPPASSLH